MRSSFKLCPNGHYYEGDYCPYCRKRTSLDTVIDEPCGYNDISRLKVCPNGHAYELDLECCPYCGETKVSRYDRDMVEAYPASLKIKFKHEITVQIDRNPEITLETLEIGYGWYTSRSWYRIVGAQDFNYKSEIRINGLLFTGKRFVEFIDFMMSVEGIENL